VHSAPRSRTMQRPICKPTSCRDVSVWRHEREYIAKRPSRTQSVPHAGCWSVSHDCHCQWLVLLLAVSLVRCPTRELAWWHGLWQAWCHAAREVVQQHQLRYQHRWPSERSGLVVMQAPSSLVQSPRRYRPSPPKVLWAPVHMAPARPWWLAPRFVAAELLWRLPPAGRLLGRSRRCTRQERLHACLGRYRATSRDT